MSAFDIGIIVSIILVAMVIMGVRVAFAAAFAGFLGLFWIFAQKMGFERGLNVAMKIAGMVPILKQQPIAYH